MPDSQLLKSVGLAICEPFSGRPICPEWALAMQLQNYPLNLKRHFMSCKGLEIGVARQSMVEEALERNAKYVWFPDDDVVPPYHAIGSLIETMANADDNTMVVAGIYCSKTFPAEPVVYREANAGAFWKWKVGDIFECAQIGTGCMLVKTEVFRHIEKPWFKTDFKPATPDHPVNYKTDDIYFCDKVIEAGFTILADTRVLCVHWDWDGEQFIPYVLPDDCYPLRPVTEKEPRCPRELESVCPTSK